MSPEPPGLTHALHLEVEVGAPIEIGRTPAGLRRVIPITGGTVSGPLMTGRILPGGADFQLIRTGTDTAADAKYVLESDRGEIVYVENLALRTGSAEDIARLRQDLPVDPGRIYFRSTPRFETEATRLARQRRRATPATVRPRQGAAQRSVRRLNPVHTGLLLQRYRSGDFAHVYPLARVAALRETSILFGAVIGVLLFRERFGPWWLAGAAVTVAGVLLLTAS